MAVRLEHANISVCDINGVIRFLQTAFPEFGVRGEGINRDGGRWVHVGTDDTYIALSESRTDRGSFRPYSGWGQAAQCCYDPVIAAGGRL